MQIVDDPGFQETIGDVTYTFKRLRVLQMARYWDAALVGSDKKPTQFQVMMAAMSALMDSAKNGGTEIPQEVLDGIPMTDFNALFSNVMGLNQLPGEDQAEQPSETESATGSTSTAA